MQNKIKYGVTLYCFTEEYARGEFSMEDCIRKVGEMGATGYEIVATQMIPSYPYISDEFLGLVKKCEELYNVHPVCYGANMDRGMRRDRNLTPDEMYARAVTDIKSASRMGCRVLRHQFLMGPDVLRRLAPVAEDYDVKVGIEIHNPERPTSPIMLEYLEQIEASGSKYIGFIPDMGCFATKPNKPNWEEALRNGTREEVLRRAAALRYDETPMAEAEKILKSELNASDREIGSVSGMWGFVTFYKKPDLEGLKYIMPHVYEFHSKFHYMYEDLHEASIPYEDVLPVIQNSEFEGYLISEYEGHGSGEDVSVQVHRHLDMEKKILGDK